MDGTGSGFCLVAGFGIRGVKFSVPITRELVNLCVRMFVNFVGNA